MAISIYRHPSSEFCTVFPSNHDISHKGIVYPRILKELGPIEHEKSIGRRREVEEIPALIDPQGPGP
ncbi:MAG TPA: hypothetical protein VIG57_20930, partial [Candidatus Entotheonella sp.]